MTKNTLWNSLLILLLAVIVVVPLFWITSSQPSRQISLVEARHLSNFPAPDYRSIKTGVKRILQRKPGEALPFILGQYLDRSYQNKFEGATSDQFPLRLPLIQTARALDRKMIELSYSPLPDPAIPAVSPDHPITLVFVSRPVNDVVIVANDFIFIGMTG